MGEYFLIANLNRQEFIDPGEFKRNPQDAGCSMKLHHICKGTLAGVLPFLLATSQFYDYMGSWARDRIIVIGDECLEWGNVFEDIRENWKDISKPVACAYLDFIADSEGKRATDREVPRPLDEATLEVQELLAKQGELLKTHGDAEVQLVFKSIDLWIFHGLIRMAADHPGFKQLSGLSHDVVERFRVFCKALWVEQGLSEEDAVKLDELREEMGEANWEMSESPPLECWLFDEE